MTEDDKLSTGVSGLKLSVVVSETNLVGNDKEWWVDTAATRHICSDRKMFSTYQKVDHGDQIFMGNSATSKVEGQGKVVLKFTSGLELILNGLLHVPDIQKNLVSGLLVNNHGFKLVFVSNKFVLTKNGVYVGKWYGLLEMNVMTVVPTVNTVINKVDSSAYMLEFSNV